MTPRRRQRIFVTGAGGFLGAATVRAALAAGHEVVALARNSTERLTAISEPLTLVKGDVADRARMAALFDEHRPGVVVHAAWSGLAGGERHATAQFAQVETCWRLAETAAAAGVRKFVGIGSQDEYGSISGRISETCAPRPTSHYGAAKAAAAILSAEVCRAAGLDFAWLRLFAIYGPDDAEHWLIPSITRQLVSGVRPRTTEGTQLWDYLYIDDAARGVVAAGVTAAQGVFNLSSGSAVAVREIVTLLRDYAAPEMELTFGEIPFRANQIMHLEGANERLMEATGWTPQIPLRDGLSRTVDACRLELETVRT
jgi:UDP-glucose 4-epimerase